MTTVGEMWQLAKEKAVTDKRLAQIVGITSTNYYKGLPSNTELKEKYERGIERLRDLPDPTDEERARYERFQNAGKTLKSRNSDRGTTSKRSYSVSPSRKATVTRKRNVKVKTNFGTKGETLEYIRKQKELRNGLQEKIAEINQDIFTAFQALENQYLEFGKEVGELKSEVFVDAERASYGSQQHSHETHIN